MEGKTRVGGRRTVDAGQFGSEHYVARSQAVDFSMRDNGTGDASHNTFLTTGTLRAAAETVRVLVSPLCYETPDDWRRAIHASLRTLLSADQAMTMLPAVGEVVMSDDLDEQALVSLRTWFSGYTPEGRINLTDPVVNEWNDRRRESGLQVYTRNIINHAINERVLESPFVTEALFPNKMRYWQGVYAKGPDNTDALLWASHERPDKAPDDNTADALLSILVPAFQAGLSTLHRLNGARQTLDAAGVPMLVFDAAGRERHRTASFEQLALNWSDTAAIVSRATQLSKTLADSFLGAAVPALASDSAANSEDARVASCALRASLLPEGLFGPTACVAVVVTPTAPAPLPAPRQLVVSFGLTVRQAEVALLLAKGSSRDAIAAELGISPFTVRAHTESVFRKLGVSSRSAVAAALILGAVPPR